MYQDATMWLRTGTKWNYPTRNRNSSFHQRVCSKTSGVCRWLAGWMAASVSSKVSWWTPDLSSPSSISSIAATTITHLHLHNKIWRVNVEEARESGERKILKKERDEKISTMTSYELCMHILPDTLWKEKKKPVALFFQCHLLYLWVFIARNCAKMT